MLRCLRKSAHNDRAFGDRGYRRLFSMTLRLRALRLRRFFNLVSESRIFGAWFKRLAHNNASSFAAIVGAEHGANGRCVLPTKKLSFQAPTSCRTVRRFDRRRKFSCGRQPRSLWPFAKGVGLRKRGCHPTASKGRQAAAGACSCQPHFHRAECGPRPF